MGFHMNLPQCLVFAPHAHGGMGLQHLCYEMEAQQIIMLLCHLRANTQLGQALQIPIGTYQLWVGISESILVDTQQCS